MAPPSCRTPSGHGSTDCTAAPGARPACGLVFVPPRDLEQPGPPAARLPEALAKSAHIGSGGLELFLAHHFPGTDAWQDQATLHGGPKHMLRLLGEVLVDMCTSGPQPP